MSATRKPAPSLCVDCGHKIDDSRFHFDAPEENWGAALHWFRSGAPLQPGATQSEHDGVANETKPIESMWPIDLTLCSLCRKDLLTTKHRWGFIGKVDCPYYPLAYTQIELNDRLERMARLVVTTLIPHQPLSDDNNEPWRCSMTDCEWKPVGEEPWVEWRDHVRDVIESKLQQLREAVERA